MKPTRKTAAAAIAAVTMMALPSVGASSAAAVMVPGQRVDRDELFDTRQRVGEAVRVVQEMRLDRTAREMMHRASGIFILSGGAQGAGGVLVVREADQWSSPLFFAIGGLSIALPTGTEGGAVALLLTSDEAIAAFKSHDRFSLNADAALTVVQFPARKQAWARTKSDIVIWSRSKGAHAGTSVSVTDIRWAGDANRAYYGARDLSPQAVLDGQVIGPEDSDLRAALSTI